MTDTQVNPMKSQPLSLGAGSAVLAFDVGGTDLKAALVDDIGSIRAVVRVPTPIDGDHTADAVVTRISELTRDLLDSNRDVHARAAGLLVPGHDVRGAGEARLSAARKTFWTGRTGAPPRRNPLQ